MLLLLDPSASDSLSTSLPKPSTIVETFDYRLLVFPNSSSVLQGDSIQINVSITPLHGTPEKVILDAQVPDGVDFAFNPPELFPKNNSILTVHSSNAVPSSSYIITVKDATQSGKSQSAQIVLAILPSQVTVSGIISASAGISLKQVVFKQLTWEGKVIQSFRAPIENASYRIVLPNQWFYALGVVYENAEGTLDTHYFVQPYRVNADVGVTTVNCGFSWS